VWTLLGCCQLTWFLVTFILCFKSNTVVILTFAVRFSHTRIKCLTTWRQLGSCWTPTSARADLFPPWDLPSRTCCVSPKDEPRSDPSEQMKFPARHLAEKTVQHRASWLHRTLAVEGLPRPHTKLPTPLLVGDTWTSTLNPVWEARFRPRRLRSWCGDVAILPQQEFYAINWRDVGQFFQPDAWPEISSALKDRSGVHLWGKHSRSLMASLKGGTDQPLLRLAFNNCPTAFRWLSTWCECGRIGRQR
jgi:hypothetical protein